MLGASFQRMIVFALESLMSHVHIAVFSASVSDTGVAATGSMEAVPRMLFRSTVLVT
jgi:hypothetical protein